MTTATTPQITAPVRMNRPIFLRCGYSRSTSDSPPTLTGFGSKRGAAAAVAFASPPSGAFLSDVLSDVLSFRSATANRDVAQFRGLVAWTSRALVLLPVISLAAPAGADGDDRALSASLGYATFSE